MILTADRESARQEARLKAQAKADQDLGLSPPDYIDNLKDKLRKKTPSSASDCDRQQAGRTRSFSESRPESWDDPVSKDPAAGVKSKQYPAVSNPHLAGEDRKTCYSIPVMSSQSASHFSLSQSPKTSDVIRGMFLSHNALPTTPTALAPSPPISPRSTESSKSSSYLWAGLSPADSQAKLDDPIVAVSLIIGYVN